MWFIRSLKRLDQEMRSVAVLVDEGWVSHVEWRVTPEDSLLCAAVKFTAGDKSRSVRLVYPHVFPYAPPRVIPEDGKRWSSHQWPSGELCLQFRAQTWSIEFTGGDLLRSARELLDTEAKTDNNGRPMRVPSGHVVTEANRLRFEYLRLILHDDLLNEVRRRGQGTWKIKLYDTLLPESNVAIAHKVMAMDETDVWISPSVPKPFTTAPATQGLIALMNPGDKVHTALLAKDMSADDIWRAFTDQPREALQTVIGVLQDSFTAKCLSGEKVWNVARIELDTQKRNPARNDILGQKKVGIVGCGSMGSKVAASLARCGVSKFVLVDGDLLTNGNLVRHELDWAEVGAHKVSALAQRLKRILPGVDVVEWDAPLGHSSTDGLLKCMALLAGCDLLVEVSGSALGFNYVGAVAIEHRLPMVWGRVFAGGYGGLFARSRPGQDPTPHEVRALIDKWCANPEFPEPPLGGEIDYSAAEDGQPAMIADDGDVAIISGMLTKLATDTLQVAERTDYPYSAYMVGLRKEWIFNEPYQTFHIDLGRPSEASLEAEGSYLGTPVSLLSTTPFKRKSA